MLLNNRYELTRMLGEGGFGKTFLAEDTQMPSKRLCVVKQLKPVTTNPELYKLVKERFQREAVILEKLGEQSNQIPRLYAYLTENEHFYLIQEWIEGSTLDNLISNQSFLSEKDVREILVALLPILEFVHSQGIIHRDIKPENIILRQHDNLPVLIDFGAVRETMGTLLNSKGNPTSSIVIGTPGYMASEQAAGRPIASSDLYSLGLTAIYLLTGKSPQELMTDSQSGEILWSNHAYSLSSEIVEILSKATRSHPRDRYSNANEMLLALLGKTANSTINTLRVPSIGESTVPPVNTIYASNNDSKHVRSLLFLGGLIAAGLIGGVIGITSFLTRITPQSSLSGNSIVTSPSSLPMQGSSPPLASNKSVTAIATPTPTKSATANLPAQESPLSNSTAKNLSKVNPQITQAISEALILNGTPSSQISIYAQPTTESSSPHYGVGGDNVTALKKAQVSDGNIWYFVRFPSGAEGWIQSDFVRSTDLQPRVASSVRQFPRSAQLTGQSIGSQVNIRSAPSIGADSPHYGLVGDRITVLKQIQGDDGNIWYFVQFPSGATGYVRDELILIQ